MNLLNKDLVAKVTTNVVVSDEELMENMIAFDDAMAELNEKDAQVEALETSLEQLMSVSTHIIEFGVSTELLDLYGEDLKSLGIVEGTDAKVAFETIDNMLMANGIDICDITNISNEDLSEDIDRFETISAAPNVVTKAAAAKAAVKSTATKAAAAAKTAGTAVKGSAAKAAAAAKTAGTAVKGSAAKAAAAAKTAGTAVKGSTALPIAAGAIGNAASAAIFTPWKLLKGTATKALSILGKVKWGWVGIVVGIAAALSVAIGAFILLMQSSAKKLGGYLKAIRVNGFQDFKASNTSVAIEPANEFISKVSACEAACKFIMNIDPNKAVKTDFKQKASLLTPLGYSLNTETGQFTKEKTTVTPLVIAEHGWTDQTITRAIEKVETLCISTKSIERVSGKFKEAIAKAKTDSGEEIPKEERAEAMMRVKEYKSFMKITMTEIGKLTKKTLVLASKTVA